MSLFVSQFLKFYFIELIMQLKKYKPILVASPSAKYISIKVDKFIDSSPVQVLFCIFLTKDNKFPVFAGDIFWMNHSFGSHVTIVIKMLIFGHRDKEE